MSLPPCRHRNRSKTRRLLVQASSPDHPTHRRRRFSADDANKTKSTRQNQPTTEDPPLPAPRRSALSPQPAPLRARQSPSWASCRLTLVPPPPDGPLIDPGS